MMNFKIRTTAKNDDMITLQFFIHTSNRVRFYYIGNVKCMIQNCSLSSSRLVFYFSCKAFHHSFTVAKEATGIPIFTGPGLITEPGPLSCGNGLGVPFIFRIKLKLKIFFQQNKINYNKLLYNTTTINLKE